MQLNLLKNLFGSKIKYNKLLAEQLVCIIIIMYAYNRKVILFSRNSNLLHPDSAHDSWLRQCIQWWVV